MFYLIQKTTILASSNYTGIINVNCFHIYQKKKKKIAVFSNFIKVSTREVLVKYKKLRKKKFKSILILLKYKYCKPDGTNVFFNINSCVLLKRRVIAVGDLISGCCYYNLKRKKFLNSFYVVI